MSFKEHFKGDTSQWEVAGEGVGNYMVIQNNKKGGLATVHGTNESSIANAKLIAQSGRMAEMLFDMVMARKDKGVEKLSMQEKFEVEEAEKILKLILK